MSAWCNIVNEILCNKHSCGLVTLTRFTLEVIPNNWSDILDNALDEQFEHAPASKAESVREHSLTQSRSLDSFAQKTHAFSVESKSDH